MSNLLEQPRQSSGADNEEQDSLRIFSRSPHPYRYPNASTTSSLESSSGSTSFRRYRSGTKVDEHDHSTHMPSWKGFEFQDYTNSDSGTEADDEHFLKGLPAPKLRPHKGLRGASDAAISGTPSPVQSPPMSNDESSKLKGARLPGSSKSRSREDDMTTASKRTRRKRRLELLRRGTEIALLSAIGAIVTSDGEMKSLIWNWRRELSSQLLTIGGLFLFYPFRIIYRKFKAEILTMKPPLILPTSFDPAPLIYPPVLAAYVALLVSKSNPGVLLPNLILGIAALPPDLVPSIGRVGGYSVSHWFLSCIPLFTFTHFRPSFLGTSSSPKSRLEANLNIEILSSLYPLHYCLCVTLHYLTTTSLLPAELHLLSIALLNVLLLASSPQVVILKALLWGGGMGVLVCCEPVIRWGVALARVPRWRFRKPERAYEIRESPYTENVVPRKRNVVRKLSNLLPIIGINAGSGSSDDEDLIPAQARRQSMDAKRLKVKLNLEKTDGSLSTVESEGVKGELNTAGEDDLQSSLLGRQRRHTLPSISDTAPPRSSYTSSGRKKRSNSSTIQPLFSLTYTEAIIRKWLYAVYVYGCVLLIILIGIRSYVGIHALKGHEPIGWALGYLFGNIPWFRLQVVFNNLDHWITLPPYPSISKSTCLQGPIPRLRHSSIGEANTRLFLVAYYLLTIMTGLLIVFRLSKVYEVDTRRKVFHGMMVLILLPTTFIDPTFCSLALALILAIFLLLDLFRASQLPPLSKPIAYFLTPYVDGRDLRGPVVVSHIFLLIGCAVPLWLSLGAMDRIGDGWELESRDVSMVSGVVCVGMGDAAASLIGRRFGRHKWLWPGGKSIEGSVAFALAVAVGLTISKIWLSIGGWVDGVNSGKGSLGWWLWGGLWQSGTIGIMGSDGWVGGELVVLASKIVTAASAASLAEAVLTGGNDNVVVPVVLWLCVKGLGI